MKQVLIPLFKLDISKTTGEDKMNSQRHFFAKHLMYFCNILKHFFPSVQRMTTGNDSFPVALICISKVKFPWLLIL